MKRDFERAKEELNQIGIVQVCRDFYIEPQFKSYKYFVKSPVSADKHWSLCLYPDNRFTDFSNSNYSGDIIGLIAYTKGISNWESLKLLRDFYGLSDGKEQSREEARRKIQQQQQNERRRKERQREFQSALSACIEDLRHWLGIYTTAIENKLYEPFSELQAYVMNELQATEYKLDILTANDCSYRRLKKVSGKEELYSDYPQWLLDVLAVLEECGVFKATAAELKQITERRNIELRRCDIERKKETCVDINGAGGRKRS